MLSRRQRLCCRAQDCHSHETQHVDMLLRALGKAPKQLCCDIGSGVCLTADFAGSEGLGLLPLCLGLSCLGDCLCLVKLWPC